MLLLVSILLFALVLALPAIPSMFEVARPKDDGRLYIAEEYVRDARWFGRAFRRKLAPFVAAARNNGPSSGAMHMRMEEDVRWAPDLSIPPHERLRGIGIGERVIVGAGAGIRDAYALEHLDVRPDVVARTLTSDATMQVGERVRVLRWIDADGDMTIGAESDLGVSAAGGARVLLRDHVRFERVWGSPVASETAGSATWPTARDQETIVVSPPMAASRTSLILHGPVRLTAGTRVVQHLKVHGNLTMEAGSHVGGNVIARGDVTVVSGATIGGHLFAEGDVRLGPGTRIGRAGVAKTVYATGEIALANDVAVFGWIVAEQGGHTL